MGCAGAGSGAGAVARGEFLEEHVVAGAIAIGN